MAEHGYGVVTGGWEGVDETAARSFARAVSVRNIPIENFLTQVIEESTLPAYSAGNLILVKKGDEEWTEAVKLADAVVLIGGLGGTLRTGEVGLAYRKAVFPLADTGGDAKKFYMHMLRTWRDDYFVSIERDKFHAVAREAPAVVADLMKLLSSA